VSGLYWRLRMRACRGVRRHGDRIGEATAVRWLRAWREGRRDALSQGGDRRSRLPAHEAWVLGLVAAEHVFATQKHRMGLAAMIPRIISRHFIRTIGIERAKMKIGMANLAYNFKRLVWHEGRSAPA
jgi:hypothetical protein